MSSTSSASAGAGRWLRTCWSGADENTVEETDGAQALCKGAARKRWKSVERVDHLATFGSGERVPHGRWQVRVDEALDHGGRRLDDSWAERYRGIEVRGRQLLRVNTVCRHEARDRGAKDVYGT